MAKGNDPYAVLPVAKAMQVFAYVTSQAHDVTLTEVVQALGMPKTTVFRYLQTLSAAGFFAHNVVQDRYGVGERFRELARMDAVYHSLRSTAQGEMDGLVGGFRETVNLAVLADDEVVYVDIREAARSQRFQARIGHRHPVHSTSLGKAIAAFLPVEAVERLVCTEFEQRTYRTLTDARTFRRHVEEARRRGFAMESGENEDGVTCVGVPILDDKGYPIAAVSLSAPDNRMQVLADRAAEALQDAARRITASLPSISLHGSV
ncbi:IclR family transcriptional regulator [Devosia sp.]|uniref:IclR family transcriptional regulator n=1 Tax=Devosia sp. TaxID=1871048 RepID=UPI002AFED11B|nr:IclR family transcriptional regulator [Devosia sp.]